MAGYGWRTAYLVLAVLAGILILLCALVMVRDPERLGLHADGIEPAATANRAALAQGADPASAPGQAVWTLAAARRTAALWLVTAVFTTTFLVIFLPMVHLVPFALDLGMAPVRAALVIGLIGAGSLVGRLLSGAVSDRLGRRWTLGLALALQALAFLGFWSSSGASLLFPSALLFGLATGSISPLFPAIIGDFFGRLSVGAIFGFVWAIAASAAAFGPLIAGYLYDVTGSYADAFVLSAVLNFGAACLVLLLRKPAPP
jgi:MFS family permease